MSHFPRAFLYTAYDKVQFHCYLNILQLEEGTVVESKAYK